MNRNSFISLGRWDEAGGTYNSKKGEMTLKRDGKVITTGKKIKNNPYKLNIWVHKAKPNNKNTSIICAATQDVPTWETWHRRYRHISYGGLKNIFIRDLVCSFKVKNNSPMPDCIACTEAKQCEQTHNKSVQWKTDPGVMTHIDLWGKYDIVSINGCQYYIVPVDNAL